MRVKIALLLVLLAACASHTGSVVLNTSQAVETGESANTLYVDPQTSQDKQRDYEGKLKIMGTNPNKRALYEEFIDAVGANGILDGIERVFSECHSQAHDAGKVIFAKVKDISTSLRICGDSCYTGCMHGVLMEAFKNANISGDEDHIDVDKLKSLLRTICFDNQEMNNAYGPGECAHGVGHALMLLSGYGIQNALNGCAGFDNKKMEYYCADGAYMEYDVVREKSDADKSLFYPCDKFAYPAGCMRTKVGLVGKKLDKVGLDLVKECEKLNGRVRLGCFHGIGTAHAKILQRGIMHINDLCSQGTHDEQVACIEGAGEFMGKYYSDKVQSVCADLDGDFKEICLAAGKHKLYNLDKDMSMYLN